MSDKDNWVEEDPQSDEQLPYIKYDIASYPSDLTLNVLKTMWDSGTIEIPSYQRNFVWSIKQASELIESFLLGLPVPPVFFYIDEKNRSIVIDGQQRILSIVYFFSGLFGQADRKDKRKIFKLELSKKSPYNGLMFESLRKEDALSEEDRRKLDSQSILRAINIRQLSPKPENNASCAYSIFERLNRGGTQLFEQEIRNCVFHGEFCDALKMLNENSYWRRLLGRRDLDKHQKDVELLLRAFSFSYYFSEYEKPMKEFLNNCMSKNRAMTSPQSKEFFDKFPLVVEYIVEELGDKPFHVNGPLNTSTLDTFFSLIYCNFDKLPGDLSGRYMSITQNEKFRELISIGSTDTKRVQDRMDFCIQRLLG